MTTGWQTETGEVIPYVVVGGEPRLLATMPADPKKSRRFGSFGASIPTVPYGEPFDRYKDLSYPIKDQDGRGACVGHATAGSAEVAYRLTNGQFRPLSAWFSYAQINGGKDGGAMISDAMASIQRHGVCPEDMVAYKTFRKREISAEATAAALLYRAENVYAINDEAELYTAVLYGHPIVFGATIGTGFQRVDAEGVPGGGLGIGGHAMFVWGGFKVSRKHGRLYRVVNSWSTAWGQDGCCWMRYDQIARGGVDAFALIHMTPTPLADDQGPIVRLA